MIGKDQSPDIGKNTQWGEGESGNPDGKPLGTKHLSTIIQELENDIDWDVTQLKDKEELKKRYGKQGLKAMVIVAFSKAMSGNVQAMTFLAKYGYGEKQIHSFEKGLFSDDKLQIEIVDGKDKAGGKTEDSPRPTE